MKIVHITSAHPALDVRIFHKECMTLAQAGYDIHLVVPSHPLVQQAGIMIHALNADVPLTRWKRLYAIYKIAQNIKGDIYHFHDPEFIPFALLLKLQRNKIIYDVHEDTPRESLAFNRQHPVRAALKYIRWRVVEAMAKLIFNGFVCATDHIAQYFPAKRTIVVKNFVKTEEFAFPAPPFRARSNVALYVGGIMQMRGLEQMINVINKIRTDDNPILKLIGPFYPPQLQQDVQALRGWQRVQYINWLARDQLIPQFYSAKVGLVLLHPHTNFQTALPIKLFEYMAAGLPVIASDFPLWRDIVSQAGCGFVVDPFDVDTIKDHIEFLFNHPEEAERMGSAGKLAVNRFYNWQSQAVKLLGFYQSLVKGDAL